MPRTISILLADNDPDDRDFFKAALAKVVFPTALTEVYDGAELLEYLQRQGRYQDTPHSLPDVVFLDLNMPLVDGLTALEQMRRQSPLKTLPVYILTTSYNLEDFKRCNRAGCHGFFTKSHQLQRLTQQITGVLETFRT